VGVGRGLPLGDRAGVFPPAARHQGFPSAGGFDSAGLYASVLRVPVFVLWSSGDPLTTFGFRRFRPVRDLPIGLALGIGMTFLNAATMLIWYDRPFGDLARGLFGWRLMAQNSGTSVLILLLVTALIASLSSEIIFRSWLIPRIEELTGRPWTAVAVSAALFALARGGATGGYSLAGFLYGVATGLLFGIAAGVVFLKARSLWPLVIGSMIWFGVQFLWLI